MQVKSYCSQNWRYDVIYPDSRRWANNSTFVPRRDWKQSRWHVSHCAPGVDCPLPRMQIKNHWSADEGMLGKSQACSFYLINLFPEFQTLSWHFSFPYKKRWLEMRSKTVFRVHNPLSSQISHEGSILVSTYWFW